MKKHISVFGLFARMSVYKVFYILVLMCIAEVGLFLSVFLPEFSGGSVGRFEYYINQSHFDVCLGLAFLIITVILCVSGTEFSSKSGYTLRRLSISETAVFYHQAVYNTIVYIFLWAAQIGIIYFISLWFSVKTSIRFINNQSIFLAFYRSDFLHTLLPLSEIMLWIRNLLLFVAIGFSSADFPFVQRRKKYGLLTVLVSVYILLFFVTGIGETSNIVISICVFIIGVCKSLCDIHHKEVSYDK